MSNPNVRRKEPNCRCSQDLINQLMLLTVYCDLLGERPGMDGETCRRVLAIRLLARSIAEELTGQDCEAEARSARELLSSQLPC